MHVRSRPISRIVQRLVPLAALSTAVLALSVMLHAAPKPSPVPQRWQLDFEAGDLRLYRDQQTDEMYWLFTYTVTNKTDHDRFWAPEFTLFTDNGRILKAGRNVPPRITDDLLALLGNPLLEKQNYVIGDIHQGKEHAKDGLVVFRAPSTDVNELSLFIAGISGETARVKHPTTGQQFILRKTLQRDYLIPGDAMARRREAIPLVSEHWVMR